MVLLDNALAPIFLVSASGFLLLFRVQDRVDTQEGAILLTVHRDGAGDGGERRWWGLPRIDRLWLGSCLALTGQLRLQLFKLEEALDLEVLRINNALAMLVDDIDVR